MNTCVIVVTSFSCTLRLKIHVFLPSTAKWSHYIGWIHGLWLWDQVEWFYHKWRDYARDDVGWSWKKATWSLQSRHASPTLCPSVSHSSHSTAPHIWIHQISSDTGLSSTDTVAVGWSMWWAITMDNKLSKLLWHYVWLTVLRTRTNYSNRGFTVQGSRVRNSLPAELRAPDISLDTFRHKLKTFLFSA